MNESIKEIEFKIKIIGSVNKDYVYCFFLFGEKMYVITFHYSRDKKNLISKQTSSRPNKSYLKLERFLGNIPLNKRIEHMIDFKFSHFVNPKKKENFDFLNKNKKDYWKMVNLLRRDIYKLDGIF